MTVIICVCIGSASNGVGRILDIGIHDIHQRTPFFIGSYDDIVKLERYRNFYSPMLS